MNSIRNRHIRVSDTGVIKEIKYEIKILLDDWNIKGHSNILKHSFILIIK